MKRYLTFLTAVLLFFALSSVSSEAADFKEDIIGKWINVKTGNKIEFLKDGTVIFGSSAGDYKFIDDDRLRMDIKGPFGGSVIVAEVSIDKDGGLNLKSPAGGIDRFLRENAYQEYKASKSQDSTDCSRDRHEEAKTGKPMCKKYWPQEDGGTYRWQPFKKK